MAGERAPEKEHRVRLLLLVAAGEATAERLGREVLQVASRAAVTPAATARRVYVGGEPSSHAHQKRLPANRPPFYERVFDRTSCRPFESGRIQSSADLRRTGRYRQQGLYKLCTSGERRGGSGRARGHPKRVRLGLLDPSNTFCAPQLTNMGGTPCTHAGAEPVQN